MGLRLCPPKPNANVCHGARNKSRDRRSLRRTSHVYHLRHHHLRTIHPKEFKPCGDLPMQLRFSFASRPSRRRRRDPLLLRRLILRSPPNRFRDHLTPRPRPRHLHLRHRGRYPACHSCPALTSPRVFITAFSRTGALLSFVCAFSYRELLILHRPFLPVSSFPWF